MPRQRTRNSLGQFQDSWFLNDGPSGGCPADRQRLPSAMPPWKFRWHVKGTRRYIEGDRGFLHRKRVRVFATTPDAAIQKAGAVEREIREHGALAKALTSEQRFIAAKIFAIAAKLAVDPLEVFRDFERTHLSAANARTLDQVRLEIVAKKRRGERRERYVQGLDYRLRCLVEAFNNAPISSITTVMLERELARHDWSSGTIHGVVTSWKVLFYYAVKHGYCRTNPCVNLELPRLRRAKPQLLPAKQVHKLLAGCITHAHMAPCLAYVAIGCFTGIRPEEMQRLRWEMIDLDAGLITIDGEDAKCGERGIVKMSPNLITWLRPIAKASGPVLKESVAKLRELCRDFLGLKRWPHDCMRHGYASFHYSFHRDIGEVCANLRHGTGQLVFINHYYIVRPPAEAVYFWSIVRPLALLATRNPDGSIWIDNPAQEARV